MVTTSQYAAWIELEKMYINASDQQGQNDKDRVKCVAFFFFSKLDRSKLDRFKVDVDVTSKYGQFCYFLETAAASEQGWQCPRFCL
jgi:hypothetical protein